MNATNKYELNLEYLIKRLSAMRIGLEPSIFKNQDFLEDAISLSTWLSSESEFQGQSIITESFERDFYNSAELISDPKEKFRDQFGRITDDLLWTISENIGASMLILQLSLSPEIDKASILDFHTQQLSSTAKKTRFIYFIKHQLWDLSTNRLGLRDAPVVTNWIKSQMVKLASETDNPDDNADSDSDKNTLIIKSGAIKKIYDFLSPYCSDDESKKRLNRLLNGEYVERKIKMNLTPTEIVLFFRHLKPKNKNQSKISSKVSKIKKVITTNFKSYDSEISLGQVNNYYLRENLANGSDFKQTLLDQWEFLKY